ncbi:ABC transporter ATP-binding protein [Niallia nealsonii]|uniref:Glutathione ABC transporter ATP-binding protein n=1 Tax=Niallia nealsonii TaxID=115979 RepID=A0A2N0Z057_9BACI|nr:ABC transporter ATP-binding protein [Niallia nealsonii]PKG22868.1 glutathione ABC transporter ATP-binding protein [Niallia nealsonii]
MLEIKELTIDFRTKKGTLTAISNLDLSMKAGETVCLVGESGSGKTITSKAIMRLIEYENGVISKGEINFQGKNITFLDQSSLQNIRGKKIAMIFQEPLSAFDPVFTIGFQITEMIRKHQKSSKVDAWNKGIELLRKVGISEPEHRMKQYPNEFSGGMLQRAMIAMAISCEPDLLIADEPTTALDVTIQLQIMELLNSLKNEYNMGLLLITHDLGIAAELADRIIVMYAGEVVEDASTSQLFDAPHHPYTRGLLQSIPKMNGAKKNKLYSIDGSIPNLNDLPTGCRFHARCPFATEKCKNIKPKLEKVNHRLTACFYSEELVKRPDWNVLNEEQKTDLQDTDAKSDPEEILFDIQNISKYYPLDKGIRFSRKQVKAVDNVSFSIKKGETFGLVGESGSGKSTLGRAILQLEKITAGKVLYEGTSLDELSNRKMSKYRKEMQMIFQDPYSSVNGRLKIGEIIAEPLKWHLNLSKKEIKEQVEGLLTMVGLKPEWYERYPHEFSGGQRQRIGIARAIALNPSFILADEAVSALDVSVQAQIINLLQELQKTMGLTYLFIGHDLGVVQHISDRVGVMYLGKIVEIAPSEELFQHPAHPYSRGLIDSIPNGKESARTKIKVEGEIPSPANPPSGCRFRTRCPFATEQCAIEEPELKEVQKDRFVACHYHLLARDKEKENIRH